MVLYLLAFARVLVTSREGLEWKARSGLALRGGRTRSGKPDPEFFGGTPKLLYNTFKFSGFF